MNFRSVTSIIFFYFAFIFLLSSGCHTTRSLSAWGEEATISPGINQLKNSALDAAIQPETWVPLAAAALLAATGADSKIQAWAYEHKPVFGSESNARNYSDHLLRASNWIYISTAVLTPSGDRIPTCLLNKSKGLAVGLSAILTTQIMTSGLKSFSGRERPDGSDSRSFPSGHTSAAAVNSTLSSRNIEYMGLNSSVERVLKIALNTLTLSTGWARIEANKHYPTDILFGAALGNFVGAFINDTFMNTYSYKVKISGNLSAHGILVQGYIRF